MVCKVNFRLKWVMPQKCQRLLANRLRHFWREPRVRQLFQKTSGFDDGACSFSWDGHEVWRHGWGCLQDNWWRREARQKSTKESAPTGK